MGKTPIDAVHSTDTKAWVSEPATAIKAADLICLQHSFGGRLSIVRGQSGEVVIAAEARDQARLDVIMDRVQSGSFEQRTVYM